MDRESVLQLLRAHISDLHRLGIRSIALFGSVARGQARQDSDVDLLVELDPPYTFDRYIQAKFYLEDLLGHPVDLVMQETSNRARALPLNRRQSMSRDPKLYLEDILSSCNKILRYTDGKSFEDFKSEDLLYDGVIRNLEIIGEAAKNTSEEIRNEYPSVEWRAISALRNIVAHEYFGIKDEIIWDIIINKLPALRSQIQYLINSSPD